MGPRKWTGRFVCQNQSSTSLCRCIQSANPWPCHCKDKIHPLLQLEKKFFSQFSLFPNSFDFFIGDGPFPPRPMLTVPTSLARSQPSFVLLSLQDKTEGEFFLQCLRSSTAGSNSPPSRLSCIWTSPARHIGTTSSSLISGPGFRAWPDCWVSAQFLHAPIPRKGSRSTTTTYKIFWLGLPTRLFLPDPNCLWLFILVRSVVLRMSFLFQNRRLG